MDQDKIDCLRDYYDTTDVAEHFAGATLQTDRRSSLDDPAGPRTTAEPPARAHVGRPDQS